MRIMPQIGLMPATRCLIDCAPDCASGNSTLALEDILQVTCPLHVEGICRPPRLAAV
eukprot:COSAG01_NODE_3086_length_6611_cov_12.899109_5_plen_57_part_00